MKASYLYVLVFPNGKLYFGVAVNTKARWQTHQRCARAGKRSRLYDAMRKHGVAGVSMEVLAVNDRSRILDMEVEAIAKHRTQDIRLGYNIAKGGDTSPVEGVGHTAVSRLKMSITRKGTGGSKNHMKRMAKIAAKKRQSPEYKEVARQAALRRWAKPGQREAQSARQRALIAANPNMVRGFVDWNASGPRPAYVGRAISAAKQANRI